MTGGTTPEFPTDMQKMIEQSVEQVRTAVTRYLDFLWMAVRIRVKMAQRNFLA